jgi:hypothetical protein
MLLSLPLSLRSGIRVMGFAKPYNEQVLLYVVTGDVAQRRLVRPWRKQGLSPTPNRNVHFEK